MAEGISIPAGAFAAMKSGAPAPAPTNAQQQPGSPAQAKAPDAPKTLLRKPPEANKPPEDATPIEKKIWKLKADGEEFDFDASDEEAVKREIMKARGADKRFKDAAQQRHEAEQFLSMLKDPKSLRKVLADPRIGVDVKKFAEDYLWEQIQEQKMSPEERAARDERRELEELRSERDREKEARSVREKEAQIAHFERQYEDTIVKALDTGKIPKTNASVKRMAELLSVAIDKGLDLSPAELVEEVRKDFLSDISSLLNASDGDMLMQFLGEANAEKLRKADLKRLKSAQGNPFPERKNPRPNRPQETTRAKKIPGSVWKENLVKDFLARK